METNPKQIDTRKRQSKQGRAQLRNAKELMVGGGASVFRVDVKGLRLGDKDFDAAPFRVNPSGELVATSLGSPSERIHTIYLVNSPSVSSDIRFKKRVQALDYGLAQVLSLKPIRYERDSSPHLGFSAQQLLEVLPEVVTQGPTLSIRPDEIVPVLVAAVQELAKRVRELEEKNG
jgi:hypothetical protein